MNDELRVWLLTASLAADIQMLNQHLHFGMQVRFLGLDELFREYGAACEEIGNGRRRVPGFDQLYDIWRYSVFVRCLDEAERRGELPDLLEHGSTWTISLAYRLVDITEVAESDDVMATFTFLSRALRSCRPEHAQVGAARYFALPFTVDCRVLYFKEPFMEQTLRSWARFEREVLDTPQHLHALVQSGARFSLQMKDDAFHDALPWIWAAGGDVVRATDLKVMINSDATVNAMMRLVRLVHVGLAPRLDQTPDSAPESLHNAREQMRDGKVHASMALHWQRIPGNAEEFSLPGFRATLPPGDLHRTGFVGGTNLAVVKKHEGGRHGVYDRAIDLLKYLCLDEYVQHRYAAFHRDLESTPAWYYNWWVGKLPPQVAVLQKWQHQDNQGRLDAGMQALLGPDDFRLPAIPQMAWIEENMKETFKNLWTEISQHVDHIGYAVDCRATVRRHFEAAAVRLKDELDGLFRVRARNTNAGEIRLLGVWGHGEISDWLNRNSYDLVVDEDRQVCRVQNSDGIRSVSFDALTNRQDRDRRAVALVKAAAASDTGCVPVPFLSREYLEEIDGLVSMWQRSRRQATGQGGITNDQKQMLKKLARMAGAAAVDQTVLSRLETLLDRPVTTLAGATCQEAARCIDVWCLELLAARSNNAHAGAVALDDRVSLANLVTQLNRRLGRPVLEGPGDAEGAAEVRFSCTVVHIQPVAAGETV